MSEQGQSVSETLGMSDSDLSAMKAFLPFLTPLVNPWLGLGLGAAGGLYSYYQKKKDAPKEREFAAKIAEVSDITGKMPDQMRFKDPNMLSEMLTGASAGQSFTNSINAMAPAVNFQNALAEDARRKAAAAELLENQQAGQRIYDSETNRMLEQGYGPISQEFDATLNPSPWTQMAPDGYYVPEYQQFQPQGFGLYPSGTYRPVPLDINTPYR